MAKVQVSVIILTYNEEANIKACLESVRELTEEFFIVDSNSTDATVKIARQYTDRIYQNPWTNYARQRQWALANLPLSHDWIFFVDADERLTAPLIGEIKKVVNKEKSDLSYGGYYVPRKFIFLGKWLRWGLGELKELRLTNRHHLEIAERAGHEVYICSKPVGNLQENMIHEDLKPLSAWIERHNGYSSNNASHLWSLQKEGFKSWQVLMAGIKKSNHQSSLYIKEVFRHRIWLRLPIGFRPVLQFIYKFFFCLGFLDGLRGAIYYILHDFWYPLLIDAKLLEAKFRHQTETPLSNKIPESFHGE